MTWDIWVRLGHWAVVGAVAFQLYSGDSISLRDNHATVGTLILGWVVFRVIWGFVGPKHARFSDFVKGPKQIFKSAVALVQRKGESVAGHTAIGGVGVVLLTLMLASISATGLFATDDIFYDGPLNSLVSNNLADRFTDFHKLAAEPFLMIVIGAHVTAILVHQFLIKEPLVQGMVHGRKPHGADAAVSSWNVRIKGFVLMALSMGGVWFGVQALA